VSKAGKQKTQATTRKQTLGEEMIAGLKKFIDVIDSREPIEKHFTVRTVVLDIKTTEYNAADLKRVRESLKISQPLLAAILGVSPKALRSWEQGARPVPRMACRFLDEIVANPGIATGKVKLLESVKK
jgi:DNA-binding transcriptional regulator YiaG